MIKARKCLSKHTHPCHDNAPRHVRSKCGNDQGTLQVEDRQSLSVVQALLDAATRLKAKTIHETALQPKQVCIRSSII